jgi:hypothetical protein
MLKRASCCRWMRVFLGIFRGFFSPTMGMRAAPCSFGRDRKTRRSSDERNPQNRRSGAPSKSETGARGCPGRMDHVCQVGPHGRATEGRREPRAGLSARGEWRRPALGGILIPARADARTRDPPARALRSSAGSRGSPARGGDLSSRAARRRAERTSHGVPLDEEDSAVPAGGWPSSVSPAARGRATCLSLLLPEPSWCIIAEQNSRSALTRSEGAVIR